MYSVESVEIYSDEHRWYLYVGALVLIYSAAFLAGCIVAVRLFPAKVRRREFEFLVSWNFLVYRLKNESFWFSIWPLVRAALFALLPAVLPSKIWQLPAASLLVLAYAGILVHYLPWKYPSANLYDAAQCFIFSLLLATAAMLIILEESDRAWIDYMLLSFLCLFLVVGLVAAAYFLRRSLGSRWMGKRYSIFLSHQKASTGIFARDLSLSMADYCLKKIFLDADFLVMLPTLLSTLSTEVDCMVVLRAVHWTQGAEAGRKCRQPKLWRARFLLYRRRSLQVNSKYI